jgi:hypothetical protein
MKTFIYTIAFGLFACGFAAAGGEGQTAMKATKRTFVVENENGFKPVAPALEAYLQKQTAPKGVHQFCVIGYAEKAKAAQSQARLRGFIGATAIA